MNQDDYVMACRRYYALDNAARRIDDLMETLRDVDADGGEVGKAMIHVSGALHTARDEAFRQSKKYGGRVWISAFPKRRSNFLRKLSTSLSTSIKRKSIPDALCRYGLTPKPERFQSDGFVLMDL